MKKIKEKKKEKKEEKKSSYWKQKAKEHDERGTKDSVQIFSRIFWVMVAFFVIGVIGCSLYHALFGIVLVEDPVPSFLKWFIITLIPGAITLGIKLYRKTKGY